MLLIDKILSSRLFEENPPVLIDVGASYGTPAIWNKIAPYSICIAFDPDSRMTGYLQSEDQGFKKIITFPCIVGPDDKSRVPFYLTKSPYCSSVLKPHGSKLDPYAFRAMFDIEQETSFEMRSLHSVLRELGFNRIDWLKTDSQGTDLRIVKSLPSQLFDTLISLDLEPGLIDAYQGEDKLYNVLEYMDKVPFWLSDIRVGNDKRISEKVEKGLDQYELVSSPCWAEVSYLNDFSLLELSRRNLLLGWIFSSLQSQHAFAAELALKGFETFGDSEFQECVESSLSAMKPVTRTLKKRIVGKLISVLQRLY